MDEALNAISIPELAALFKEYEQDSEFTASTAGKDCLEAAICILFVREDDQWKLLLTRRTETVRDHKGQVSFPGGAREDEDTSLRETALRETWEEIGVHPKDIQILGQLASMKTVSNYIITPFIGVMPWPYPLTLAENEVSRVFLVPLDWLWDDNHWEKTWINGLPDGVRRQVIKYHLYDGELLWGISAYFAQQVVKVLKEHTRL